MILDVVVYPDPKKVLETKAEEVTVFDAELKQFVKDMHETMHHAGGIGLAANQVGVLKRVITMNIPFDGERYEQTEEEREEWHDKAITLINPVITKKAGKFKFQEGCLSFPEIFEVVERAEEIWVTAKDENGKEFELHGTGIFAVCVQHEIDHIDGIVFINRMSRLKAGIVRKKLARRGRPETAINQSAESL